MPIFRPGAGGQSPFDLLLRDDMFFNLFRDDVCVVERHQLRTVVYTDVSIFFNYKLGRAVLCLRASCRDLRRDLLWLHRKLFWRWGRSAYAFGPNYPLSVWGGHSRALIAQPRMGTVLNVDPLSAKDDRIKKDGTFLVPRDEKSGVFADYVCFSKEELLANPWLILGSECVTGPPTTPAFFPPLIFKNFDTKWIARSRGIFPARIVVDYRDKAVLNYWRQQEKIHRRVSVHLYHLLVCHPDILLAAYHVRSKQVLGEVSIS